MSGQEKAKHGKGQGPRASTALAGFDLGTGPAPRRSSRHTTGYAAVPTAATAKSAPHRSQTTKPVTDANPLWKRNHIEEFVKFMQGFFGYSGSHKKSADQDLPRRVNFLALFSYSSFSEKVWMFVGLIFAFIAGLCLPTWLILLARALDTFARIAQVIMLGGDGFALLQSELNKLVGAFGILGCISLVVGFAYVSIWTWTGERQALRIKEKFVHSALRQDAEWFDTNNREELPTSIANSMIHISGAIGRSVADLFANAVSAFASLFVAIFMDAPLALVMLSVIPVVSLIIALISCFSRKASRQGAQEFVAAGALATEVISGIKTVASLCAESWALKTYSRHIEKAQKHSIYGGFLAGLMSGITGFLFYITYMVAFTLGTYQVRENMQIQVIIECLFSDDPNCRVSGASVMCCIYGVILCATFFGLMAPGLQNINLGRQAAATIFATINRIPVIDADSDIGTTVDKLQGEIEFQKVFFAYPTQPQRPIFYDFNLKIKAGSSVAFVGPSGSGKSTIAKLMLRFYCPMGGSILVDGNPLGSLRLSWWRKQVGYVAQSPILFPGTIRYNIGCGLDEATEEQVIEAAKAACAHEFIKDLPDGYDTYYSGASVQLSGGQMQRICIARAMIRKPAVLLLDEATSALDTNSERQVQDALANIRQVKQVTTITVAHRLSTIVSCDQIAVISGGSIAELGPHQTLIRMGGIYTTLCESQGITAESTFESSSIPAANPSKDAVEVSFMGDNDNATAPDIENGLNKIEVPTEDQDELEDLYASPWRILLLNKKEWGYVFMGVIGAMMVGALAPVEGILTARMVENFYTVRPDKLMEVNAPEIAAFGLLGCVALLGNLLSGCGFQYLGTA